jgi:rubredoxin-NAD+ reductase
MTESGKSYLCLACGWVYDPSQGDPDGGIPPGTPWEEIPDDWMCPVCGAGKADFEPVEERPPHEAAAPAGAARPLVIVGSGLAGYSLAKELRKRDRELPIVLITADGGEVYTKPMLSNAIARRRRPDDMVQMQAAVMAEELGISIRTRTRVTAIDRTARRLSLEGDGEGGALEYDRLVLALGADPRVHPVEGAEAVEISTVNDLDDYRRWRDRIDRGGRILLIGAGLIGCEFANDLVAGGFQVTMVDPAPWPLARLLPEQIGRMLTSALERAGCSLYMGRTVVRYAASESGFLAELDDGTQVSFEHALSAVGLTPRTSLAKQAGQDTGAGIRVDRLLRTGDPAIFAIGDCAETAAGPLPFIAPLLAQARALAATLSGQETPLQLPALPVVVKTPALPLVVCPPRPGTEGAWRVQMGEGEAVALFRTADGSEVGFALAGGKTAQQQTLAKRMPELLPAEAAEAPAAAGTRYECIVCGHVYDPAEGDPDSGIPPGTPWEALPDDWVCPVCGAGKGDFNPL